MTLRDDVRGYFEREARRMPAPGNLRMTDFRARAAPAPERSTPAIRWAAVVAAMLAIAIIAGLMAGRQLHNLLNPPLTPGHHIRVMSNQIEQVIDFDLADRNDGWVLIAVCRDVPLGDLGSCQFWVEATHDGGHSWVDPVKVGPQYLGFDADTPRHIHFANLSDGFVYGLGVAFVTHDGGRTWTLLPGETSELVAITGVATVWSVLEPCARGAVCPWAVGTSTDGGRSWSASAPLPVGFQPVQAVAFGSSGLLLAGPGTGDMALTVDGGRTWRSIPGRCSAATVANYVATTNGEELWQLCNITGTPIAIKLFVSADSGKTWVENSNLPGEGALPSIGVQTMLLVSTQPGHALLDIGELPIELTTDGGRNWTPVTSTAYYDALVFSSSSEGWAEHGAIYATHDGGRTWTKLPSQPV